ncbi:MAG: winged helix-turn-helix transcriptional regulator [Anaerolineaceae bacterium]|nr:winged helix-turn-helix transcriptional regulator [Anaerolineaceae bacterium]
MNMIQESEKSIQKEGQLFKVLSHPARLAILDELRQDEACVCHLEAKLGVRQAYLSQQLSVLRDAGLIVDRKDGWNVYYRTADAALYQVLDAARTFLNIPELQINIEQVSACPCPKCSPESK